MTAPDELLLGFARALRSAGLPVTTDRSRTFLEAVARVGLGDRRATYWAGRATLCSGPEDFAAYDRAFREWFDEEHPAGVSAHDEGVPEEGPVGGEAGGDDEAAASDLEVLRHRDIATLDADDRALLQELFAALRPVPPRRTSRRRGPARRGEVDAPRTLRRTLRRMGEPAAVAHRRRGRRPRRVVLLVDVSGSMTAYADAVLRLAHRISRAGPTEVFSIGTRLTRLTPAMQARDTGHALAAVGDLVPDWSGGTRLGEGLRFFLDRWGQRGLAHGAVVVVFSDGWERGDARLLGQQMERLHLLAHRVVWVNPHKGVPGFQPIQLGMVTALPHVDDFVAGHSLATFAEVLEVVARA